MVGEFLEQLRGAMAALDVAQHIASKSNQECLTTHDALLVQSLRNRIEELHDSIVRRP